MVRCSNIFSIPGIFSKSRSYKSRQNDTPWPGFRCETESAREHFVSDQPEHVLIAFHIEFPMRPERRARIQEFFEIELELRRRRQSFAAGIECSVSRQHGPTAVEAYLARTEPPMDALPRVGIVQRLSQQIVQSSACSKVGLVFRRASFFSRVSSPTSRVTMKFGSLSVCENKTRECSRGPACVIRRARPQRTSHWVGTRRRSSSNQLTTTRIP